MSDPTTIDSPQEAVASDPLFSLVAAKVALLDRPGYPEAGICGHLGVSFACGDDSVGICDYGGKLLVTIYRGDSQYQKDERGNPIVVGYPESVHEQRKEGLSRKLGCAIYDAWNGGEGCTGVSVCFDRPAPKALACGIANYHALPNVFRLSEDEQSRFRLFNDWLNVQGLAPATGGAPSTVS